MLLCDRMIDFDSCLFRCMLSDRIMWMLNIRCDDNKRKISLKVDTPRIVCYVPGCTERKAAAAAGRRSRGWETSSLKFLSRVLLKASFSFRPRREGEKNWAPSALISDGG